MDLTHKAAIFLQEKLYYLQMVPNIARFYPFSSPIFCIRHVIFCFSPESPGAQLPGLPFPAAGS